MMQDLFCRRCGISMPTLRKWWRRYHAEGEAGFKSRSCRQNSSPPVEADVHVETLILSEKEKKAWTEAT